MDDEAPARLPPENQSEQATNFFQPEFKLVSSEDRTATLTELASRIERWHTSGRNQGKPAPDGLVLVMPEGYGKSHLVLDLVERGFKVVFCAKSHSQLNEKEFGFRDLHDLRTHRLVSRRKHFRTQLELLGLPGHRFKFVENMPSNPYASSEVAMVDTLAALEKLFDEHSVPYNANEFFREHYELFEADKVIEAVDADVYLVTFAAMQALATGHRIRWWKRLGLIGKTVYKTHDEDIDAEEEQSYLDHAEQSLAEAESDSSDANLNTFLRRAIHYPFQRIAIIYDDPDRSDVDWLRRISDETAEKLERSNATRATWRNKKENPAYWAEKYPHLAKVLSAGRRERNDKIRAQPKHKLISYKESTFLERPIELSVGRGLQDGTVSPKIIITTTEWLTGYYALQTLKRSRLRAADHVDLFHSVECLVTAISTTITRKRNHAVLIPIVEKLKQEFPNEDVTLIADGIGCDLNLSNNKGRNDLSEAATIIKLSWPHPTINATIGAHFADVEDPDYDLMIATQLADLGNQAIGRNQGFRFRGKQAIVLVDPKYYKVIIERDLLRYKLTPWSSKLPNFNKKTTKKAALAALDFSSDQPLLERRLLELIHNFETFGLSTEAQRLVKRVPEPQRAAYDKWLAEHGSPEALAIKAAEEANRRAKNAEKVRRHRERKKVQ